jgi:hypothetical protein
MMLLIISPTIIIYSLLITIFIITIKIMNIIINQFIDNLYFQKCHKTKKIKMFIKMNSFKNLSKINYNIKFLI